MPASPFSLFRLARTLCVDFGPFGGRSEDEDSVVLISAITPAMVDSIESAGTSSLTPSPSPSVLARREAERACSSCVSHTAAPEGPERAGGSEARPELVNGVTQEAVESESVADTVADVVVVSALALGVLGVVAFAGMVASEAVAFEAVSGMASLSSGGPPASNGGPSAAIGVSGGGGRFGGRPRFRFTVASGRGGGESTTAAGTFTSEAAGGIAGSSS